MHALAHAYTYCPLCRLSNALWQQVPVHARSVRPADYKSTCWLLFACLFKFLFLFLFLSFFFLSFFFFFFFFSFDPWCVGGFFSLVFNQLHFPVFPQIELRCRAFTTRGRAGFSTMDRSLVHFRTMESALLSPIVFRRCGVLLLFL